MSLRRLALLALVLALCARQTPAGEIVGYDPAPNSASRAAYDRYTSGFPNAPVMNSSSAFVGAGLDLTGVGNSTSGDWGVTLVSPQHFVTANHAKGYSPSDTVRFLGSDGVLHSYAVAVDTVNGVSTVRQTRLTTTFADTPGGPTRTLPSDILVVTLAGPVDTNVVKPLAVAGNTAPNGTPLLAYVHDTRAPADTRQFGTNAVSGSGLASFDTSSTPTTEATAVIGYEYNRSRAGDVALTGGDSGGALLTREGNTAVLLGTHYGVDGDPNNPSDPSRTYTSYSTDLASYLDQLSSIVAADGQSLTIVPVPEPATTGLVVTALLAGVGLSRRAGGRQPPVVGPSRIGPANGVTASQQWPTTGG